MKNRIVSAAAALLIMITTGASSQPSRPDTGSPPADGQVLPVTRVVLFTNGVGYFQREGRVTGSGGIELKFNVKDINDLLKSLVLRDYDGGRITGVNYSSREPLAKTLKTFSLDLSGSPDIPTLLRQARGERIEIFADKRYEGTILGTENRKNLETGTDSVFLNLLGPGGLQSVSYNAVTGLNFTDPKLNAELASALTLISESRNTDKKGVTIKYSGEGARRIQAGYLLETPVWKTSYRLVVGDGPRHILQGWAIVENTTDDDWRGIKLDLISGMPVSFAMDLYQPLFNPRPIIAYAVQRAIQSRTYAGGVAAAPPPAPSAASAPMPAPRAYERESAKRAMSGAVMAEEADAAFDPTEGVSAAASAEAVGEFFRYSVQEAVDLPRSQSAMIPILNENIEGERISIYNEGTLKKNPMNGLLLKNTTSLSLMGGPLTVFEGGFYAGDARIDNLPPGAKRIVSYSVDGETEVLTLDRSLPELITHVRLRRGTLFTSKTLKKERTYTLVNRGEKSRTVLIEYPAAAGWKLLEPASYDERTEDLYRFRVKTEAKRDAKTELKIVEERSIEQSAALANMGTDTIFFYTGQGSISSAVRSALETLAKMKNDLADTTRQKQDVEAQISRIHGEQQRIRSNMGSLDRTSALYQRYMTALNDQENTLNGLKERLDALQVRETAGKKAVDDYMMNLDIG
jgi:hypothetical protein